jgi:hypothetical protein
VLPTFSHSKQHAVIGAENAFLAKPLTDVWFTKYGAKMELRKSRSSNSQADESNDFYFQTDEISLAFEALTHFDFAVNEFGPI